MDQLIPFAATLLAGLLLWIIGSVKKGRKEERRVGWVIIYVFGIITTLATLFMIGIVFSLGFISGFNEARLRGLAIKTLEVAKKTSDASLAKDAVGYAKKAMTNATSEKLMELDYQIYQSANEVAQKLEENKNTSSSPSSSSSVSEPASTLAPTSVPNSEPTSMSAAPSQTPAPDTTIQSAASAPAPTSTSATPTASTTP